MQPTGGNVLLDAGEGTWGQMARFFGADKGAPGNAYDVLRDVKLVYVSHVHGDHCMGLGRLLAARREVRAIVLLRWGLG
jgi:ribonuclease Z